MPITLAHDELRGHAARLAARPVHLADLALGFAESEAATAEVLGGDAFYPPMLADLAAATSSIHLNQFGFRPGAVADAFADAIVDRARAGVAVRLVVDLRGSDPLGRSRALYDRLVRAGAEVCVVRATRPWTRTGPIGSGGALAVNRDGIGHIDHRKALVIDGATGWIGGAGIEDHFRDGRFHDVAVRLTGPVVGQLQLVFMAGFRWLGGAVAAAQVAALFPPLDGGRAPIPALVLHNAPGPYRPITDEIARLLDAARTTLDVVNPYVTDRRMIGRIESAARRGVHVRLFVPGRSNNPRCEAALRRHYPGLLAAGVRILEHPAMLHAKAFARDGEELLIGTCNLEVWSLRRFFEIDVRLRSAELAAQFDERFAVPAEAVSTPGRPLTGRVDRVLARLAAAASRLV